MNTPLQSEPVHRNRFAAVREGENRTGIEPQACSSGQTKCSCAFLSTCCNDGSTCTCPFGWPACN